MKRIVFLCAHLSGTGHLVRTLALGRAAQARGHEVTVISGGRPLAHVDSSDVPFVQLPPLTVKGLDFSTYWTPEGGQASSAYMAERRALLSLAVKSAQPDVLVTELWPFGRRALAPEFQAAIHAADHPRPFPRPTVVCSVRDVPEPKPKRRAEVSATLAELFDGALVHGDAAFLPLWQTWPGLDRRHPPILHTGYVSPPMPLGGERNDRVLVSVGGGDLGRHLLDMAAQAAAHTTRPWHLLVGGADAEAFAQTLRSSHPHANLRVEPTRPDYRELLASAACSISLCGYNTAVELARCRTPAILIPEDSAGEQEQVIRADRLGAYPGFQVMRTADVTPKGLAKAADRLAAGSSRPIVPLRLDDGTGAIEALEHLTTRKARV